MTENQTSELEQLAKKAREMGKKMDELMWETYNGSPDLIRRCIAECLSPATTTSYVPNLAIFYSKWINEEEKGRFWKELAKETKGAWLGEEVTSIERATQLIRDLKPGNAADLLSFLPRETAYYLQNEWFRMTTLGLLKECRIIPEGDIFWKELFSEYCKKLCEPSLVNYSFLLTTEHGLGKMGDDQFYELFFNAEKCPNQTYPGEIISKILSRQISKYNRREAITFVSMASEIMLRVENELSIKNSRTMEKIIDTYNEYIEFEVA